MGGGWVGGFVEACRHIHTQRHAYNAAYVVTYVHVDLYKQTCMLA